jgi:SAM-dependent methyltransferase
MTSPDPRSVEPPMTRHLKVAPERDAYGQEMWNCHQGVTDYEVVERDDGLIDIGSARQYFQDYRAWPSHEREAIRHAHGRVLDIGCGAGRVSLYLQSKGHRVTGIDNSPLAVKVARLRGVKSVRVLSIDDIGTLRGKFATIVMYGNNFGLFASFRKAHRLLAVMGEITTPDATILAAATNPYSTRDPLHLAYHQRNRNRGRMGGQIRLRIRYRTFRGHWFDYLFASTDEVHSIVEKTAWTLSRIVESPGPEYVAMLRKK